MSVDFCQDLVSCQVHEIKLSSRTFEAFHETTRLFQVGYCPSAVRPGAFRVCAHFFRRFSHRAVVGASQHGLYLLDQHFLEHQRHLAQFLA